MKYSVTILTFILANILFANELVDIVKLDNDITLIRCTEQFNYTTQLSEDKKNITLNILNVSNTINDNSIKLRSDLQKEVFVSNNGNNVKLNLILTNSSGYNTYQLPYSNSLIIESFRWEGISKAEEDYRDGLFAYDSKLYGEAINNFSKVKSTKHQTGIKGLVYLFQDSVLLSYESLLLAARNNSYLPDVYAALSQIHLQIGDTTKANYYNQRFLDKLNIKDSSFSYPKLIFDTSNLNLNNYTEVIDSTNVSGIESKSEQSKFSNLFDTIDREQNTATSSNNESLGTSTTEIKDLAIYAIIGFILISLLVLAYYLKWRKMKLEKQKDKARTDFEIELKKETKTTKPESLVYDRTAGIKDKKTNSSTILKPKEFRNDTNFELSNANEFVEYKNSLDNIDISPNSNIDIDKIDQLENSSKSKLFRKYFVSNK